MKCNGYDGYNGYYGHDKKHEALKRELRILKDQPVRVFTDDERVITGVDIGVEDNSVRILAKCGDVFLIDLDHIASLEEPMMRLRNRCCKMRCENDDDRDDDDECDEREEFRGRNRY